MSDTEKISRNIAGVFAAIVGLGLMIGGGYVSAYFVFQRRGGGECAGPDGAMLIFGGMLVGFAIAIMFILAFFVLYDWIESKIWRKP